MIEKYYEDELRYLYEAGREFSKAYPERARYLNIDSVGDRDPYVERLFEGFAFIAGRIREKLDDTFPQLTEGLINLLWPQFLHEIPSLAIAQFQPRNGTLQESKTIPVRSEIMSGPVGTESVICRFTTTQPVVLNPIQLNSVSKETDKFKNTTFTFKFGLDTSVEWNKFNLKSIRLFIHAELPTALMLHRMLTMSVKKMDVQIGADGPVYQVDPSKGITPGGFGKEETLLPTMKHSFWGYNLLREYFVFPEKFLFIDLNCISALPFQQPTPEFITFKITVQESFPDDKSFSQTMFKLNCTPISNLFITNTDPILKSGLQPEYRITADSSFKKSIRVHSLRSVYGNDRSTGEQTKYEPFYSFINIGDKRINSYTTSFVNSTAGSREMNIMLSGSQLNKDEIKQETLVIEAWCTNGDVPREKIHEGDITNPGKGFPDYVQIKNITRPTASVLPPQNNELLWIFQAHLAVTQTGLASKDVFKKFMQLYNWSESEGKSRRIESIIDINNEPIEIVYKGSIIHGVRFILKLEEEAFQDSGDLHLFGLVLSHFLSQYVQINTFCELQFVLKPSGLTMTWNHVEGKRCLI